MKRPGDWLKRKKKVRIRLLRDYSKDGKKIHRAGEVINLDTFDACALIRANVAMQEKSLDGASETKQSERKNT